MAQVTKPVEGQFDGKDMAGVLGCLPYQVALERLEGGATGRQLSGEHMSYSNLNRAHTR